MEELRQKLAMLGPAAPPSSVAAAATLRVQDAMARVVAITLAVGGPLCGAALLSSRGVGAAAMLAIGGVLSGFVTNSVRSHMTRSLARRIEESLDSGGLGAVGGLTSAAMPAFGAPAAPKPALGPPPFVEPVRPAPREGDLDAEDFDDE